MTQPPAPMPCADVAGGPVRLSPPVGLAVSVAVLAVAVTAAQVVCLVLGIEYGRLDDVALSGRPVDQELAAATNAYLLATGARFAVLVAAGFTACAWLEESRAFAQVRTPGARHVRSRIWVWFGWVVPVVAWWFPYQVVRDIAVATRRAPARWLPLWWIGWVVFVSALVIATTRYEILVGTYLLAELIAVPAVLVALAGWLKIIRDVTQAQRSPLGP